MTAKTLSPDLEYYIGRLQPHYEVAGQAEIGRMLDEYAIPFFYKQPLLVWEDGQRKVHGPDFTLPTYNNAVIEYCPNHNLTAERVKSLYRQNNIAAVFLGESDLTEPNWQQRLYERLEEIYHQPPAYFVGDRR